MSPLITLQGDLRDESGSPIDLLPVAIVVVTANGTIQWANRAFRELTGLDVLSPGESLPELLAPPPAWPRIWRRACEAALGKPFTMRLRRGTDLLWVECRASRSIVQDDTSASLLLLTMVDVSDRVRREERLLREAFRDPLTGLANRALFLDRTRQALRRRRKPHEHVGLLFVDLDRFKEINDRYGHPMADDLLVRAAARIARCVRPEDTVARYGGDEFIILLDGLHDAHEAQAVAERIRNAVARPFTIRGDWVQIGCSIGIALAPLLRIAAEPLVESADRALYRAKADGGGIRLSVEPREEEP